MIHLYCGDGKGKTTAAVGLAVRAAGNGRKVCFIQFLKSGATGEINILQKLENVSVMRTEVNKKFTFQMTSEERAAAAAENMKLLQYARQEAAAGNADMLVLDEAATAVERSMIDEEVLKALVEDFPDNIELVITGSRPEAWMVEAADYVTDMEKIKHPFDRGIAARKGVEY